MIQPKVNLLFQSFYYDTFYYSPRIVLHIQYDKSWVSFYAPYQWSINLALFFFKYNYFLTALSCQLDIKQVTMMCEYFLNSLFCTPCRVDFCSTNITMLFQLYDNDFNCYLVEYFHKFIFLIYISLGSSWPFAIPYIHQNQLRIFTYTTYK